MPDIIPLYESPETGQLHQDASGKAFYKQVADSQDDRPSMSWHPPGRGIGGSDSSVGSNKALPPLPKPGDSPDASTRKMTPEEMMALADRIEQDFLQQTRYAKQPHQSSVEPTLVKDYALKPEIPDWLTQYMERQPNASPYQPPIAPSRVDMIMNNKYLNEREKLKLLKAQQDSATF